MATSQYTTIRKFDSEMRIALVILAAIMAIGLLSAYRMEHEGHWITGMTNQVVWGMPHVFAIFLIVTASGVLNVASLSSVFSAGAYSPWSRLSGLLSITLLLGGLTVLVLDLGRPDRLIVAMTHYNFKSIFAWNIFLYTGFLLLVACYLWMMFEPRMNRYVRSLGIASLTWRIVLTTGTGSIFGFLVARDAYDTAIMAPLFIAMSLSYGSAFFVLVANALGVAEKNFLDRLSRLTAWFVIAVLALTAILHLTKLYATGLHDFERFLLLDGGIYTALFWIGHVLLGSIVPLVLLLRSGTKMRTRALVACALVILGGFANLYVIVIGGQAFPLQMFPGKAVSSSFFDGMVASYSPSLVEVALGLGGTAFALLAALVAIRVLPFLPEAGERSR